MLYASLYSNSQEFIYNRGLATLSVGVAIPAYDFSNESGIYLSSYAKTGTNITGEISYYHSWNVGFNFMFTYSVNAVDVDGLAESYMNESPAFETVSAQSEAFRDFAGLGGVVFNLPMNEYFALNFKLMTGLRNVYKPTALIETTTVFSEVKYYETHDNQLIMAFLFSGGTKVKVNDVFNVHFNVSYMGSHYEFNYYRNSNEINQKAHIGILTVAAGVSYVF